MSKIVDVIKYYVYGKFPSLFMSEEQIVNDIMKRMKPKDKQTWLDVEEHELILGHHTIGRNIRNHYLLWHPNNPYTRYKDGEDANHPDNLSFRVIETVWKKCNLSR